MPGAVVVPGQRPHAQSFVDLRGRAGWHCDRYTRHLPAHSGRQYLPTGGRQRSCREYSVSPVRHALWAQLSNTPNADGESRRFYVTHPFHPLFERQFELLEYRKCWGEERVFYLDEERDVRSLPARWTSAVADDPWIVIASGRTMFRVDDLLELVLLIQGIKR